ncbi:MAG: prolipoprotein diacylglyceryl transferase [Clostridia bacterium]|nr:prolipoprotein diacylglyceryl transferase [Clostridia bacterium]
MHRFFGEQDAYSLFNSIYSFLTVIGSIFYFKIKRESISIYSKIVIQLVSQKKLKIGKLFLNIEKVVEFILVSAESMLIAEVCVRAYRMNKPFGSLVGTGANYFGLLFTVWLFVILVSLILFSNPIKQLDIATLFLPFAQIFVRLACYFNGCCWGIPWKYGPYNYHYAHPGNQVPVQAIEVSFVFIIYLFLLWYKKRAKIGTMFPLYMILYGGARFFNEFFTAADPDIIGPFNIYHVLCTISVVIGLVLFIVMRKYGEKISNFFEIPQRKFEEKVFQSKEMRTKKIAEENAKAETDMLERLEKAKKAREKASIKYKK